MNDLLGGHVPVAFGVLPPALGNLASGNLNAIAVLSKDRFSLLRTCRPRPNRGCRHSRPCCAIGILAPAGTPKPIVDRLNKELRRW